MSFLKNVKVLAAPLENQNLLETAKTNLAKCVLMGDRKSPKFITALDRWRKAWKAFYGYTFPKEHEGNFLDFLSSVQEPDAIPQMEKKKA